MSPRQTPYTYAEAGVDIDRGDALVDAIRGHAASTRRPGADAALGGFGALFDLKAAGFRDPILVATTDGVGTKLKLALETGQHGTVGIDLVAMCVNDLVVQGAEPLLFLDYYASAALDVAVAAEVIAGIAQGCREAGCALAGGETAEMPGLYAKGDYDLAGFALGAVERGKVLPRADITPGDVMLAIASSGPHSNGYSLIRRIVAEEKLDYSARAPFADATLGKALIEPTHIYVKSALRAYRTGHLKALAHITGGGLTENIPRVLPKGTCAEIDLSLLPKRPVFSWLARFVEPSEMLRTFNCGVGLVAICAPSAAAAVQAAFTAEGETVFAIGTIGTADAGSPARTRYRGTLGL